jgi:hypothetical protein
VEPVVEPVRVSTEAQTEGPAIGAGAGVPPWWLRPPPWTLPCPMAAGREPVGGPWYPPGPPQAMKEDHLVERVVSRLVDILGPRLAVQNPPRAREDLREAHQGLHAGAPEVEELSLLEELPLASSTGVRVEDRRPMSGHHEGHHEGHHGLYLDHGEAPLRAAELRAPAALDARSIAWDLGQFASDLSPITPQTEIAMFVKYATIVEAGHMLAPQTKRKLVVGGGP